MGLVSIATYLKKYLNFDNTTIIDITGETIEDMKKILELMEYMIMKYISFGIL